MEKHAKLNKWHTMSREWLSELQRIKEEHLFFENLTNNTDFNLITGKNKINKAEVLDVINRSEKRNIVLKNNIKMYISDLLPLLDNAQQINDLELYNQKQRLLKDAITDYTKHYNRTKTQLVGIIENIKKEENARTLLNRRDYLEPAV